ncbi:cytochrome c5 family protein [Sneathiella sp. P13V-1]|uniref:c-type cytochrome n=1 Tax=Sneathiella sp. P13V-1 TaxID=2697366 RepID=UPI00187B5351|nr:c-type cytochrome [Sneathiella sp. P13V-1]MBE7637764.1 cytochrome c5 family protein [Sneathiella sp. P13V-1]
MKKIILGFGAISLIAVGAYFFFGSGGATVSALSDLQLRYAENATPSDPTQAEIYDRSCRACHTDKESKAPLTGHSEAWQTRMNARGMDGLINSVKNGLETMPAMGLCNDCGDDDFKRLIEFMAKEAS